MKLQICVVACFSSRRSRSRDHPSMPHCICFHFSPPPHSDLFSLSFTFKYKLKYKYRLRYKLKNYTSTNTDPNENSITDTNRNQDSNTNTFTLFSRLFPAIYFHPQFTIHSVSGQLSMYFCFSLFRIKFIASSNSSS